MAIDTVSFAIDPIKIQWAGMGEPARELTDIPRSEFRYSLINGVIPIPTGGNSTLLTIDCTLPSNFTWAFVEISMIIKGTAGESMTFDDTAAARISDGVWEYWSEGFSEGKALLVGSATGYTQARVYVFKPIMKSIIDELGTARPSLFLQVGNGSVDHKACTVTLFARFLQYDVNQGLHAALNTPTLTR